MRLPDEHDKEPKMSVSAVYAVTAVTLFVIGILTLVLFLNNRNRWEKKETGASVSTASTASETVVPETSGLASRPEVTPGSGLKPEDLDFWDMYPEETRETEKSQEVPVTKEPEADPATDGKHTLITYADGKEEWVLISPHLLKHEYDFTNLVLGGGIMKYYEDSRKTSYVGADISKYQEYVDFVKLKKAGVDFVMLRVGARGYGNGDLLLDSYFADNIKRASDAGLEVGVYFFSQAITKEEAIEEANMVLENIKDYKITYPIAFDMEMIEKDTSRIERLSREEKTNIAKTFLDTVKGAGYKPMLYGNKEWLIKKVDLSKLNSYDIWLSQPGDIPDFPYKFTMWQYSATATIDGISGYADLNISFINYPEK